MIALMVANPPSAEDSKWFADESNVKLVTF